MVEDHYTRAKGIHWSQSRDWIRGICRDGFAAYARSLPNFYQAFQPPIRRTLHCIDERVPGGFCSAGSGILRDRTRVAAWARALGIEHVTSHAGCGAAKLAAQACGCVDCTDEFGKRFAAELAAAIGASHVHLGFDQMVGPAEFHVAHVAYVIGVPFFDPHAIPEFPQGFTVSRRHLDPRESFREVELAVQIALGDHGYGGLFTREDPFLVVPIGDRFCYSEFSDRALVAELRALPARYDGRIVISGFTPDFV